MSEGSNADAYWGAYFQNNLFAAVEYFESKISYCQQKQIDHSTETVHIVTPDGDEICSTRGEWESMASDWQQLSACIACPNCKQSVGELANHAAGCNH